MSSTDITITPTNELVRGTDTETLIRTQFGLQKATDAEIEYFFQVCNRTGLDPITRQIYAIMRWDARARAERLVIQTGIDGLRSVAADTGDYAGSDAPVFEYGLDEETPVLARVTVWKIVQGQRVAFTGEARWSEFVQTGKSGQPIGQWRTMRHNQLAKCAEAQALRKGFPRQLGGVYESAELEAERDGRTPGVIEAQETVEYATEYQASVLAAIATACGYQKNASDFADTLAEDFSTRMSSALALAKSNGVLDDAACFELNGVVSAQGSLGDVEAILAGGTA